VVYGAVWSEKFAVTHIRATTKIDRDRMRTSKYVQSDIHLVFESIKNDVATGILVLFTGTPCQCAAVTRLFGKQEPENLFIMDMVCHGVMSQEFFDAYLADVCQKHPGQEIEAINMRDKRYGWQMIGIDFADGTQYHSEEDYFYKAYAAHALQRPSCFNCTCAIEKRFGDFTVGDFWGVQKSHPELYDELGVSLVLVNSPKAQEIYCQLEQNVVSVPIEPKDYLPYQPNLSSPTPRGKKADKFASYYNKYGYKITMHRFFDVTFMRRVNALGYKLLKKFLYK
jgi:coenzyme F420-reducing hydrogenase beta subunit